MISRGARGAIAALALLVVLGTGARAEDNSGIEPRAAGCAPFPATDSEFPDLQHLAVALCDSLGGHRGADDSSSDWSVRIGAWADASYLDDDLSGDDSSVALNHVNLHVDTRWRDRWQLFLETEYEYEPDLAGLDSETEFEIEQAYLQFNHDDRLHVRWGRFSTPFGYWNPVHWAINVDTIEAPIFEENRLIPEQQIGIDVFGSFFPGDLDGQDVQLDYSLYAGYAASGLNPGNPRGWTGGGDLRLRFADRYMVGTSFYAQQNSDEDDRNERNVMLYGQLDLPFALTFRSEYLLQFRDGKTKPDFSRNIGIFYAKLRWDLTSRTYLNYRFSYGDDDRFGQTDDHRIHTATFGYRPISRLRIKLEYARHEFAASSNPDYDAWGAWLGVLF